MIKNKKKISIIVAIGILLTTVGVLALNGAFGGGASIPSDTMTRGLVGYWSMDEGRGTTTADISGNGNTGTLQNNMATTSWTSGKSGSALSFDGVDDYVDAGNGASLNPTDAITIGGWIKLSATGVGHVIMSRQTGGGQTYSLWIDDNNKLRLLISSDGATWDGGIIGSTSLSAGIWYYAVGTYDKANLKLYLNGASDATPVAFSSSIYSGTATNRIGRDSATTYMNGLIDDVRIYNRALSAEEIRYHYNRGGPVAYWKFDEGSGQTAWDSSGSTNSGTLGTGSSVDTSDPAWTSGKYGPALSFDGVDDYVSAGNPTSLQLTGNMTIEAWINITAFPASGSDKAIVSKEASGWGGYGMYLGSNIAGQQQKLSFLRDGALDSSNSNLVLNKWTHVVIAKGATLQFFIDGVLDKDMAAPTNNTSASNLFIGKETSGGAYFNGLIDDVKIYNYARTQDEIALDYNAGFAAKFGGSANCDLNPGACMTKNLVTHLSFDEGRGTTATDISGNNNPGVLGAGASKPAWAKGKVAGALSFDINDNVTIEDSDNHVWSVTSGAVETWINPATTTAGDSPTLLARWVGAERGAYDFLFYFNSAAGQVACDCWNVTLNSGSVTIATGTWSHIAATWGTFGVRLYVNGVQVGTSATLVTFTTGTQDIYIGQKRTGYNFQGLIDEVKIYNRNLSAQEIRYHYNRGGPVGYWKFDEGSGQTAWDSSGSTNSGTLGTGSSVDTSDPAWTSGKYGSALSFDGVDDYVNAGSGASLRGFENNISLEAWINPNKLTGLQIIVGKTSQGTPTQYPLIIDVSGDKADARVYWDTTGYGATWSTTLTMGVWYHIVGTFDQTLASNNIKLYVNGVLRAQTTFTQLMGVNTRNLIIGDRATTPDYPFNGLIDDVRIYNYARTQDEIALDYNAGFAAKFGGSANCDLNPGACMTKGLVGYWGMDEGRGTTTADISGNGNTGIFATAASSPAWTQGKVGSALSFNGTTTYVNAGNGASLNITNAITIEAWIYPTASQIPASGGEYVVGKSNSYILSYGHVSSAGWRGTLAIDSSGAGVWKTPSSGVVISANAWHHFVGSYDGSFIRVYLDGVLKLSENIGTYSIGSTTNSVFIGNYAAGGDGSFPGLIDEVRVYNRALSAAEVRYHYNQGKPIAWWKFDEGSGQTAWDSSGSTNSGTLGTGSSVDTSDPAWTSGKYGSALNFDGVNDYVDAGSGTSLAITSAITLEAWVKPNTIQSSGFREIVGRQSGANIYLLRVAANGYISLYLYGLDDPTITDTTAPLSAGAWYHITGSYDSTAQKAYIYINGVAVQSVTRSGSISATGNLLIGAYNSTTNLFSGLIDDVRIYNYARTQDQILQDYNGGFGARLK